MKIKKWITVEQEINIDLDVDDLRALMLEADYADERLGLLVARAVGVLRGVPEDKLVPEVRKALTNALKDEAERFAVTEERIAND